MSRLVALVAMLALLSAAPASAAEQRVALVIGNGAYRHVDHLANPANDARLIAGTLRDLGFRLIGGAAQIDLDKRQMEQAIGQLAASVARGDTALFYYAGHGVQIDGVNELIPVDAAPATAADIAVQSVPAERALAAMDRAGADIKLLILDACRNNPFAEMMASGRGIRLPNASAATAARTGLAVMRAPRGTIISFATQPDSVALDGAAKDSPYSIALAHALRQPDLDVVKMFNRVGLDVGAATDDQQNPWLAISALDRDVFLGQPVGSAAASGGPVAAVPMMHKTAKPQPGSAPGSAGLSCPAAGTTALRNGSVPVQYQGESAPGICLQMVAGVPQSRGFGIWPADWDGASRAAAALTEALAGPPGTSRDFAVSFEVRTFRLTINESWRFTVTYDGAGQVVVAGKSRPVRLVRWDERSLGHVYGAEANLALDAATGAVLSQSFRVTQGDPAGAYDFWAKTGGGPWTAGDFRVTALH